MLWFGSATVPTSRCAIGAVAGVIDLAGSLFANGRVPAESGPRRIPLTSAGSNLGVARRSHLGSRNSLFARAGYVRFSVGIPASISSQRPPLFLLYACGVHRVVPQRRFAADPRGKLSRRVAESIDTDLVQALDDARVARRLRHLLRDTVDDLLRRRGGRHKPVPGVTAKARIELRDRRQIWQLRSALLAGDGEQPDLAAIRVLDHV